MRSVNKAIILGHVGSDPEIRTTGTGVKVARFSLATNDPPRTNQRTGEVVETPPQWHRVTVWDRVADIVEQYVRKGDRMYVEGKLRYSSVTEGDVTRYFTEIVAREIVMLGGKNGERADVTVSAAPGGEDDDDLPF